MSKTDVPKVFGTGPVSKDANTGGKKLPLKENTKGTGLPKRAITLDTVKSMFKENPPQPKRGDLEKTIKSM